MIVILSVVLGLFALALLFGWIAWAVEESLRRGDAADSAPPAPEARGTADMLIAILQARGFSATFSGSMIELTCRRCRWSVAVTHYTPPGMIDELTDGHHLECPEAAWLVKR